MLFLDGVYVDGANGTGGKQLVARCASRAVGNRLIGLKPLLRNGFGRFSPI